MEQISFDLRDYLGKRTQENTSAFATKNQRIREQHKTVAGKVRTWLKRQLSPGGLLPDAVFQEKIARDSEFEVIEFDIKHMVGQLERAITADYGLRAEALDEETQRLLQAALAGDIDPSIPEATRVVLLGMRQYIDGLSEKYIEALGAQAQDLIARAEETGDNRLIAEAAERARLMEVIQSNVGEYVHRSYRAFDDPNWFKKVPDEVLDAARAYLVERFAESMPAAEAEKRAEVVIHEILKHNTAYDGIEGFIKEAKLGAKDLSVLKKRKQIAPEIRALLGEHLEINQPARRYTAEEATRVGPPNLDLDLDDSNPYEQVATREGTTEAQQEAGRAAMQALRRRLFAMRAEGVGDSAGGDTISILGAAIGFAPELQHVIYDFESRQFIDTRTGERRTDEDVESLAERLSGASPARYLGGSATQARAALVNTLAREQGKEGWRRVLASLVDQLQGRGLDPELHKRLYARNAPAASGLSADQFRAALVDRFGEAGVKSLESQGLLNILDLNDPEVSQDLLASLNPNHPAWYSRIMDALRSLPSALCLQFGHNGHWGCHHQWQQRVGQWSCPWISIASTPWHSRLRPDPAQSWKQH